MSAAHAAQAVLARQPIFDTERRVVAYELLFRNADGATQVIDDHGQATSHVLSAALGDIGLPAIVGTKRAFVNVDRDFLLRHADLPFSAADVGLELLEDQVVDDDLIARLEHLVYEEGFALALDDYTVTPGHERLLALAHIVKLDVLALGVDGAIAHQRALADYDVDVLAEKLEDEAEFVRCADAGFNLFQGYFFCRPELVSGRQLPSGGATALTAAGLLSKPDVSFETIEEIVTNDPALSLRLLRLLNSVAFRRGHEITTVRQAMMMLGANRVREWATITALAGVESPWNELLPTALTRAHTLRSLARQRGDDDHAAFTIGLLSVCDAMLGVPMHEALDGLALAAPSRAALIEGAGPDGASLRALRQHEAADGDATTVTDPTLAAAYLDGLVFSQQTRYVVAA